MTPSYSIQSSSHSHPTPNLVLLSVRWPKRAAISMWSTATSTCIGLKHPAASHTISQVRHGRSGGLCTKLILVPKHSAKRANSPDGSSSLQEQRLESLSSDTCSTSAGTGRLWGSSWKGWGDLSVGPKTLGSSATVEKSTEQVAKANAKISKESWAASGFLQGNTVGTARGALQPWARSVLSDPSRIMHLG